MLRRRRGEGAEREPTVHRRRHRLQWRGGNGTRVKPTSAQAPVSGGTPPSTPPPDSQRDTTLPLHVAVLDASPRLANPGSPSQPCGPPGMEADWMYTEEGGSGSFWEAASLPGCSSFPGIRKGSSLPSIWRAGCRPPVQRRSTGGAGGRDGPQV